MKVGNEPGFEVETFHDQRCADAFGLLDGASGIKTRASGRMAASADAASTDARAIFAQSNDGLAVASTVSVRELCDGVVGRGSSTDSGTGVCPSMQDCFIQRVASSALLFGGIKATSCGLQRSSEGDPLTHPVPSPRQVRPTILSASVTSRRRPSPRFPRY